MCEGRSVAHSRDVGKVSIIRCTCIICTETTESSKAFNCVLQSYKPSAEAV